VARHPTITAERPFDVGVMVSQIHRVRPPKKIDIGTLPPGRAASRSAVIPSGSWRERSWVTRALIPKGSPASRTDPRRELPRSHPQGHVIARCCRHPGIALDEGSLVVLGIMTTDNSVARPDAHHSCLCGTDYQARTSHIRAEIDQGRSLFSLLGVQGGIINGIGLIGKRRWCGLEYAPRPPALITTRVRD